MVRIVDADVCKHCLDEFQWIKQVVCPGCGQSQSTNKLCIECVAWQKQTGFVIKNRALLSYNEAMQKLYEAVQIYWRLPAQAGI